MGIERLLALWQDQGHRHETPAPDAYLVHQGEAAGRFAFRIAEHLRSSGYAIQLHCGGGSFKSQMKKADRSLARYALILGDDEVNNQQVTLKPMQFDTQSETRPEQVLCSIEEAIKIMTAGKN